MVKNDPELTKTIFSYFSDNYDTIVRMVLSHNKKA